MENKAKKDDKADDDKADEDKEADQFFDASDRLVEESKSANKDNPATEAVGINQKADTTKWQELKRVVASLTDRIVPHKDENNPRSTDQMIISIKDEHKRELQEEEDNAKSDENRTKEESPSNSEDRNRKEVEKTKKMLSISGRRTEVTVFNEEEIKIDTNEIEMNASDSVKFLFNLITVLILDLFILFVTIHWIFNYLEGLDWKLLSNTYFNYHILFMTLGLCSFGIGMLTHRMFRGWSSGALKCVHTFISLTTLIFFVIGVYSVIVSLTNLESTHFSSVHSWLGMLSILSFLTSWISAFVIYIFPRFVEDIQSVLSPVHSFFGRIVFTLVCAAAVTGLSDKLRISDTDIDVGPIDTNAKLKSNHTEKITLSSWKIPNEVLLCNWIAVALLVFAVFVNYLSSNESYKRRLLPQEQGIDIKTTYVDN